MKQQDLFDDLPPKEFRDAIFSDCRTYRYVLTRQWNKNLPLILFVGLNPSHGDEERDTPTIENLRRICIHKGFGGFFLMNLYALITPHPEELSDNDNPIGDNDYFIDRMKDDFIHVCFCWGNLQYKFMNERAEQVEKMFDKNKIICLGRNQNGSPKHPLYISKEIEFQKY